MYKLIKGKGALFTVAAAVLLSLSGVLCKGVFADVTVIDPSLSIDSSQVVIPNGTSTGKMMPSGVRVSFDNTGDLVAGGSIILEAPSGTKFDTTNPPQIGFTGPAFAAGAVTYTGPGGVNSVTVTMPNIGSTTSSFFTTSNTKFELVISSVTGTGTLQIGSSTAATTSQVNRLNFLPTDSSKNNNVNTPNLKLKGTVNANTTNAASVEGGDLDLLAEPRIVDAVMVDTSTVDVTFNVEVGSTAGASGPGGTTPVIGSFIINRNGTASDKAAGTTLVAGTDVLTHDSADKKKVRLALATGGTVPLDFEYIPRVAASANGIANRDSGTNTTYTWNTITNNDATNRKAFPIRKSSSAAISSVALSKTRVGARTEAGVNSLSGNKFSATFKVTPANQPIKFKLVRSSDTSSNPAPLDTGSITTFVSSTGEAVTTGMTAKIGGTHVGREDGSQERQSSSYAFDGYNADVFAIKGSQVASGEVQVDFILGSAAGATAYDAFVNNGELDGYDLNTNVGTATAIGIDNEVGVKIAASVDDFKTIVKSDEMVVDKKGPVLITSGADAPSATSRNQIKLKFDSALDSSTVTDSAYWRVGEGSTLNKHSISSIQLGTDTTSVTINTASLFTQSATNVNVSVAQYGTPTSAIEDLYYNPVFGTTTTTSYGVPGFVAIGTVTAPAGSANSLSAGPTAVGNVDISNQANRLALTLGADAGLTLGNVHIQAFDATSGFGTPQSVLKTGTTLDTTTPPGVDLTETSSGVYKGTLVLYSGLSSSSIQVWAIVSADVPTKASDWSAAIKSNSVNVDNVKPTVNTPAQYDAPSNTVTVQFSEGMNATQLSQQANFPSVKNTTKGGSIDVLSVTVASDKKQAVYKLLQTPEVNSKYVVDFTTTLIDDAGNAVNDADVAGTDRAAFDTTTVLPTPTPTATATPTATPVTSPTPTPTPSTVGNITGTVVSAPLGAPISGATVSTSPGTFTATTGTSGAYAVSNVTPGAYTVTASKTGFVSSSQAVSVTAGVTSTANFGLVAVATPTPTATPVTSPTATPTPKPPCEPASISADPASPLKLLKEESEDVTVTVSGAANCLAAGKTVTATINTGKKRISISKTSVVTDATGEATFTITATKKTGNAKVTFTAGTKSLKYTVKVRKK